MGNRTTCALGFALLVGCARAGDVTHAARNDRCGNDARYLAPGGDAFAVRSHAQVAALTREHRAALRFRCSTGEGCELPKDRELTIRLKPSPQTLCERSSCNRLGIMEHMPLRSPPDSPCRPVVTTLSTMSLQTDAGLLKEPVFEHTLVLDGPDLAANYVVSENLGSLRRALSADTHDKVMLEVALMLSGGQLRGKLKAWLETAEPESSEQQNVRALWQADVGAP
jgi:hypothetical protein